MRRGDGADLTNPIIQRLATGMDSAIFLETVMAEAPRFRNGDRLLESGMKRRPADGLILEFGVFSGRTLNLLAGLTPRTVYGFDSFEGLPEDWRPGFGKGRFAANLPEIVKNAELVVGWFDQTLPGFLAAHPGPIALLHVDCDLYSSTRTIFTLCRERIIPGTVIVFDEYFNYPGWRKHEHRAFQELIAETGYSYEWLGVVPRRQQAGVVIR